MSVSNRGVFRSRLQVLHIPVLLVAPLGSDPMMQPGTNQHEDRADGCLEIIHGNTSDRGVFNGVYSRFLCCLCRQVVLLCSQTSGLAFAPGLLKAAGLQPLVTGLLRCRLPCTRLLYSDHCSCTPKPARLTVPTCS